jgi:hypothetical protein
MGLDQGGRINAIAPHAFQNRPEARLRKSRDHQAAVVLAVGKVDLDATALEIDEI